MSGYQDISDFDECAIILTQMFVSDWDDLTPGERGLRVVRTRTELSKLRTKWVGEVETLFLHAARERDIYLETLTEAQEAGTRAQLRAQALAAMLRRVVSDAQCTAACTPENCTTFEIMALLEKT